MNAKQYQIGDYAMMIDSLIYIREEQNTGQYWVDYVYYDRPKLIGEGGGSSGTWDASCFRPINNPTAMIAAKVHAARRDLQNAKAAQKNAEHEICVWLAAADALNMVSAIIEEIQDVVE